MLKNPQAAPQMKAHGVENSQKMLMYQRLVDYAFSTVFALSSIHLRLFQHAARIRARK